MTKRGKRSFGGWMPGMLVLLATSLGAQQGYGPEIYVGRLMNPAAAQQIETSLVTNPHDLNARARLLGYYSLRAGQDPALRLARLRQIEWLIKNEPASLLLRDRTARLQPSDFAPPYGAYRDSLRAAWKEQVNSHPNDAAVIENAWRSFGGVEFGINGASVSAAEYVSGGTFAEYLKRLRMVEPGDPEWALELAGTYALALSRATAPGTADDAKRLATMIFDELEKSDDVAVIGLTGALLKTARSPQTSLIPGLITKTGLDEDDLLLRRAAALNPKNPAWKLALSTTAPANPADFATALTSLLRETDLWPGGVVPVMAVPPGAIHMDAADEQSRRPPLILEGLPPTAFGTGCSARFDALIGRDGKIKSLQLVAFDRLSIPFIAAARDALRQAQYRSMLVDGQPVEVVTQIDETCPKAPLLHPDASPAGGAALRSVVTKLELLKKVEPQYPPLAKRSRVQGVVRLNAVIGKDGTVQKLTLIEGNPLLVPAAIDAAKQWIYKPPVLNGESGTVTTEIKLNFTLSPSGSEEVPPGSISPPAIVTKREPQYTQEAIDAKLEGTILIRLIVGADGVPQDVQVVRGLGLGLDEQAVEAVRNWRFKPGMKDGKPVPVQVQVQVNFRLGQR